MLVYCLDEHVVLADVRIDVAVLVILRVEYRQRSVPVRDTADLDDVMHAVYRQGVPVEVQLRVIAFNDEARNVRYLTPDCRALALAELIVVRDAHRLDDLAARVEEEIIRDSVLRIIDVHIRADAVQRDSEKRDDDALLVLRECEVRRCYWPCLRVCDDRASTALLVLEHCEAVDVAHIRQWQFCRCVLACPLQEADITADVLVRANLVISEVVELARMVPLQEAAEPVERQMEIPHVRHFARTVRLDFLRREAVSQVDLSRRLCEELSQQRHEIPAITFDDSRQVRRFQDFGFLVCHVLTPFSRPCPALQPDAPRLAEPCPATHRTRFGRARRASPAAL